MLFKILEQFHASKKRSTSSSTIQPSTKKSSNTAKKKKLKNVKTFTLKRINRSNLATLGGIFHGNIEICKTLENPWRDNEPGVSCIPLGVYLCKKDTTGKFQYWSVENVEGRSNIEIHQGNKSQDTKGCILIGRNFSFDDYEPMVMASKLTLNKLKRDKILPDIFYLEVVNEVVYA